MGRSPERAEKRQQGPAGLGARLLFAAVLAAVVAAAWPGAAAAATSVPDSRRVAIEGVKGPGPASYDRVWVRKYGPRNPSCVLVLVPGSPAGQGGFGWVAGDIAKRVDGLAVWAMDRRSNALEDTAPFRRGTAGDTLPYYFGGAPFEGRHFEPVDADQAPWARRWGAAMTLGDLRRVVLAASDGGRRCVILGGHSFGALEVPAYAAWDFHGKPGFRDLDGLVMIDGGLFNAFGDLLKQDGFAPFANVGEAKARIEALQTETPFNSDEGGGIPEWQVGVVPEIVCDYALEQPDAPSALQTGGFGDLILTEPPPFPVTNEAFAGLFNKQALGDQGARLGHLATSGDPRGWNDGSYSSVARFCSTFTQEPGNGMEWYFPVRLEIDLAQGMEQMVPNATTRYLGLRPQHLSEIDTPLYVLETKLSDGGVLRAAHKFVRKSQIRNPTLVDAPRMNHYDPLMDVPAKNKFVKTVVPFLKRSMRRSEGG
jgi:hypothetical protein